jgi:hypothetical protein
MSLQLELFCEDVWIEAVADYLHKKPDQAVPAIVQYAVNADHQSSIIAQRRYMLALSLSMPQQPLVPRTGTPHLDLEAVMGSICLQSSFDGVFDGVAGMREFRCGAVCWRVLHLRSSLLRAQITRLIGTLR